MPIGQFLQEAIAPLAQALPIRILGRDGFITADDFRDFAFANAVRLRGGQNPRFFEGTRVADAAAEVLNAAPARAAE